MEKWKIAGIGIIAYTGYKLVIVLSLKEFAVKEFRGEWIFLATGLLKKLDGFRHALGRPVMVSPAPGSMLRWGEEGESQHKYGRAIDIMLPQGPDLATAYERAKTIGFTGIGLYPDWKPYPGMHLDIRPGRKPGDPAKWAGIKQDGQQIYVSIERIIGNA